MNIIIFGATGTIGQHLVHQSLAEGHNVTAFVRNPSKLEIKHANLHLIQGDVLVDQDKIVEAMENQDSVMIALGAGIKGGVRAEGTKNVINAMKTAGVNRLVCHSTLGAGDSFKTLNLKWKFLFRVPLRAAMADHEAQEVLVRESGLEWTLVRPAAFTDGPQTGSYEHGFRSKDKNRSLTISRADVAHFMLRQLKETAYRYQAPTLSN